MKSFVTLPIIRAFLRFRVVTLHPSLRTRQFDESKLSVEVVSVFGSENPSSKALQLRVRNDHLHQPLRKTLSAMCFEHEHVGDPRECRVVGYDAREPDLLVAFVDTKRQRVLDRNSNSFRGSPGGPIRSVKKAMYHFDVELLFVGSDRVVAPLPMTVHAYSQKVCGFSPQAIAVLPAYQPLCNSGSIRPSQAQIQTTECCKYQALRCGPFQCSNQTDPLRRSVLRHRSQHNPGRKQYLALPTRRHVEFQAAGCLHLHKRSRH